MDLNLNFKCRQLQYCTFDGVEAALGVEAAHERDEAAVAVAVALVLRSRPHDLHGGERSEHAEELAQVLLVHLRVQVSQEEVRRLLVLRVVVRQVVHCKNAKDLD